MKILTLDASTKSTGFAVFDNKKLIDYNYIKATSNDLVKRIFKMTEGIEEILLKHNDIEIIVMEEVRPEKGRNIQTYRALMWLQAAINFLVYSKYDKIKIEYVYPSEWRKSCGIKQGAGVKRDELKLRDIEFISNTYKIDIDSDDIADAIGIGYHYINLNKKELNWN